jgi:hypothetical protein
MNEKQGQVAAAGMSTAAATDIDRFGFLVYKKQRWSLSGSPLCGSSVYCSFWCIIFLAIPFPEVF